MIEEIRCDRCDKFLGFADIECYRGNYDSTYYCENHKPER